MVLMRMRSLGLALALYASSGAALNDQCLTATQVTCGSSTAGDTTASPFDGTWDCGVVHSSNQAWFYVDAGTGQLDVSTCNAATTWDTQISIYSGPSCDNVTCVDGVDDGCAAGGLQTFISSGVTAGRYYIMVHGFGLAKGTFTLDVACTVPSPNPSLSRSPSPRSGSRSASPPRTASKSPSPPRSQSPRSTSPSASGNPSGSTSSSPAPSRSRSPASRSQSRSPSPALSPPPSNEQCGVAIPVTCGTTVYGDTTAARFDGTWDCTVVHSAPQVWYYVDAGVGQLDLSMCNAATTWDTQLSVYTGADCTNLTCVDGVDDGCAGTMQSLLSTPITPGRYYIMVHGFGSDRGPFALTVGCVTPSPPASASAKASQSSSPSKAPSNSRSTRASKSPSQRSASRSASQPRTASPVPTPSPLASAIPSRSPSRVSSSPAPVNSVCTSAISLQCGTSTLGDTTFAAFDGTWDCGPVHSSTQLWYFVDVSAGQLQASLCNAVTTWDTLISVYSGLDCNTMTCVAGVDDGCGATLQSLLVSDVPAGRYYIMVHGTATAAGLFQLDLTCTSGVLQSPASPLPAASPIADSPAASPQFFANEQCAQAVPLQCGGRGTGDTTWATNDGTADCVTTHTSGQLWFYVDIGAGQLLASLCNAATVWDTQLSIFSGPNCGALTCVDGIDDGCANGVQSLLSLNGAAAGRYYIMVHGYGVDAGSFALDLTCSVPSPVNPSRSPLTSKSPRSPVVSANPSASPNTSPAPSSSLSQSPMSGSRSPATSKRPSRSESPRSGSRSNSPRSASPVSSPIALAAAVAIDAPVAVTETAPTSSNGAYYAFLAIIPVAAVGVLFIIRRRRQHEFSTELDYHQTQDIPLCGYRTPCDGLTSSKVNQTGKAEVDADTITVHCQGNVALEY